MKKILSLVLSCAICFTAMAAVSCQEEKPNVTPPAQTVERLELETTNLLLVLGDKIELPVSYNPLDGEVLKWTSSAPNIVSVNEKGIVEGLKVGKATVTANYGSKQASCQVEVSLSGNVPVLDFDSGIGSEITLMKNTAFDFGACVRFNGKTFQDGEIEYYVTNESVGCMENGKFAAKNEVGSTQVSFFATWRGQTVHSKTVTVNVIGETTVLLNQGKLTSLALYTAEEHEGERYSTSETISSVFVSESGTEITDYELSVLDTGIASLTQSDEEWHITAKKAGKTTLLVSYADKEFPFEIVVKRPIAEYGEKVEYSLTDGKYFDGENMQDLSDLVDGFGTLVSYDYKGTENKAVDGKVNLSEGEGQVVTLYNERVGYQVSLDVYTTIIDELKDFEKIYAGTTKKTVSGLYMLGKDIIQPNSVLSMPAGMRANDFSGTFDGKGHVLSFTLEHGTEQAFGLFGCLLKGATLKNFALYNVTQDGTTSSKPAGILCHEVEQNTTESTFENIYVDVQFSQSRSTNLALMHNAGWASVLKNVIIHVAEVPASEVYGSFARGECSSVRDSYVISTAPTYLNTLENKTFNKDKLPTLYESYEALKTAGNDYSSFDNGYWDITAYGVPVWKTLVAEFKK